MIIGWHLKQVQAEQKTEGAHKSLGSLNDKMLPYKIRKKTKNYK